MFKIYSFRIEWGGEGAPQGAYKLNRLGLIEKVTLEQANHAGLGMSLRGGTHRSAIARTMGFILSAARGEACYAYILQRRASINSKVLA